MLLLGGLTLPTIETVSGGVAAAATPSWAIVPSPSPPAPSNGELHGVSCPTSANCFVVGAGGDNAPLVGRSNGASWSTSSGAAPAPSTIAPELASISCPSATVCVAVGDFFDTSDAVDKVLVETWDGASWTLGAGVLPPGAGASKLTGIACPTATSCFAVGFATYGLNTDSQTNRALIERYDGTSWSIVNGTDPIGASSSQLSGVACAGPVSCDAVGSFSGTDASTILGGLVERWDGTGWSVVPSANAPTADASGHRTTELRGVSCPTSGTCIAVGDYGTDVVNQYTDAPNVAPLVEQLVGSTSTLTFPPNPSTADSTILDAVSCPTTTACFAGGRDSDLVDLVGSSANTLAEHFNGTTWSIVHGSQAPAGPIGHFDAVSCPSTTDCVVVGGIGAHVERWNGSQLSQIMKGGSQSELRAVSCSSPSACFAVGDYYAGYARRALVERWNGAAWSAVATPDPPGFTEGGLNSISCPTSTTCFAAGMYYGKRSLALIERWNGSRWSIVSGTEPPGATETMPSGVSCSTPTDCFVVGIYYTSSGIKSLLDHWDGKKWSLVAGPKGPVVSIAGISCPVKNRCFAAGAFNSGGAYAAMVLGWNGTRWSLTVGLSRSDALSSISCATATSCTAVGSQAAPRSGIPSRTLTARWSGGRWTVVAAPSPPGIILLSSVSCATPQSCVAVGTSSTHAYPQDASLPLIERWDGSRWSLVASPHPAGVSVNAISGVSCPAATSCLAVGSYTTAESTWTLAERYS